MDQNIFADSSPIFAENPEPRCASILLLDTSASMAGAPLQELQDGLMAYKDELFADTLARKRVEVAIVTFGGIVQVAQPFTTAESFTPPTLIANGDTPMAAAVITALDLLQSRKAEYRTAAIGYYRPWVFLITDGAPTDMNKPEWAEAVKRVKEGEEKKAFSFFGVGIEGADIERLGQLCIRKPITLKGLRFRDLFVWLSSSQQTVSQSKPGDAVPLTSPTGPEGWGSV